jgi:hypothetical protein
MQVDKAWISHDALAIRSVGMVRIGRALSTGVVHRGPLQCGKHVGPNSNHPEKQGQRRKRGGFFNDGADHLRLPSI